MMFKNLSIILTIFLVASNAIAEEQIKIRLNNPNITEATAIGAPTCIFLDALISGIEQNQTAELVSISTPDLEFDEHPSGHNAMFEIIKRDINSKATYCDNSGIVMKEIKAVAGNINLTPTTQFIRVYQVSKPLKEGDKIFLNIKFNINNKVERVVSTVAVVKKYENLLQAEEKKILMNAEKLDKMSTKK